MTNVSIIIPLYNKETTIDLCLKSVLSQTVPCEIIIVDDGSTDCSVAIAKKYLVKIINMKHTGKPSLAFNEGLKCATGNVIFRIDADEIISPEFVETCLRHFNNPKTVATLVNFYPRLPSNNFEKMFFAFRSVFPFTKDRLRLRVFRRDFAENFGSFNCNLTVFEDLDLKKKFSRLSSDMNLNIEVEDEVKLIHIEDSSLYGFFRHSIWYGKYIFQLPKISLFSFLSNLFGIFLIVLLPVSVVGLFVAMDSFFKIIFCLHVATFLAINAFFVSLGYFRTRSIYSLFLPFILSVRAYGWFIGMLIVLPVFPKNS